MERLGEAGGGTTPQPRSGRAARDPRRSGGGWHKGAREKPQWGFLGRDRTSARPNDSAHTEKYPEAGAEP